MKNLWFEALVDDITEYKVLSDSSGLHLATIKKRGGEWLLWDLLPGVCLDRDSVKSISKKLKELNNGK